MERAIGRPAQSVNGVIGTLAVLWDMVADADTVNDARWHAKFAVNVNTVQTSFAPAASPYSYAYYRRSRRRFPSCATKS